MKIVAGKEVSYYKVDTHIRPDTDDEQPGNAYLSSGNDYYKNNATMRGQESWRGQHKNQDNEGDGGSLGVDSEGDDSGVRVRVFVTFIANLRNRERRDNPHQCNHPCLAESDIEDVSSDCLIWRHF
ncbi:hypothetical protein J6590_082018 [Homalodisca vitripennis]|nr:hypothetical protein J6590_082018 [Homalodisca vitripennis]